jgi:hypothetical protein
MSGALFIGHGRLAARRGFVFIVALGAMAILTIVAATANLASLRGYHQIGQLQPRAQLNVIAQSCLDAIASKTTALSPGMIFFELKGETDDEWTISASLDSIDDLAVGDAIYQQWGIAPREGDVRLTLKIVVKEPNGEAQLTKLSYLWNLNGRLTRPLFLFRGA